MAKTTEFARELVRLPFAAVRFEERLYPRVEGHDPETVANYVRDMASIEAAERYPAVSADNVLLDGRHRMLAYEKLADGADFEVTVWRYDVRDEADCLRLACLLQDRGRALSNDDRSEMARRMYRAGKLKQKDIAAALGVAPSTVSGWVRNEAQEVKKRKKKRAHWLWERGHSHREISGQLNVPRSTIAGWLGVAENSDGELSATYARGAIPPEITAPYCGLGAMSEPQWLDWLLYHLTMPGDVVIDPFAGGGATHTVCRQRGRRCVVSDPDVSPGDYGHLMEAAPLSIPAPREAASLVYLNPWRMGRDGERWTVNHDELDHLVNEAKACLTNGYVAAIAPTWSLEGDGSRLNSVSEMHPYMEHIIVRLDDHLTPEDIEHISGPIGWPISLAVWRVGDPKKPVTVYPDPGDPDPVEGPDHWKEQGFEIGDLGEARAWRVEREATHCA